MSQSAEMILIGKSTESLLTEIERIKAWDNGHDYPIIVSAETGKSFSDSISNVENAIKNNLADYLIENFGNKRNLLKSGGNDDLFFVPNPDIFCREDNAFKKIRHKATNFTPSKKKRKKHKRY
jgi:hypothetical protein